MRRIVSATTDNLIIRGTENVVLTMVSGLQNGAHGPQGRPERRRNRFQIVFEGLQGPSESLQRPSKASLGRPSEASRSPLGRSTAKSRFRLRTSKGSQSPHLESLRRPPEAHLEEAQQKTGFVQDIQQKRSLLHFNTCSPQT